MMPIQIGLSYFSRKTYVVCTHWKRLIETRNELHKKRFHGVVRNFLPTLVLSPLALSVVSSAADSGIASSILAQSHTFMEIDRESFLQSADSRRVVVSYKRKYVHQVLVNCLVKLAQEKKCG